MKTRGQGSDSRWCCSFTPNGWVQQGMLHPPFLKWEHQARPLAQLLSCVASIACADGLRQGCEAH